MMDAPAGRLPDEWKTALPREPAFRSRQIFEALHKQNKRRWQEITNLPAVLREQLAARGPLVESRAETLEDRQDGTRKVVVSFKDDIQVEAVLLEDAAGRRTACLSSQAGCAMGCRFCRTGQLGLQRSLTPGEIVEQLWHLEALKGPMDNIVFMGMGEPFANYDNWARSVEILTHPRGRAMSPRRMTVSTCGLPEGIRRLSREALGVRLALSLTSADPALRREMMPITRKHPLEELRRALLDYQRAGGKRVTLEMVLMGGKNDTAAEVQRLKEFTRGLSVMVNLIPWNPVPGLPYHEPSVDQIEWFKGQLAQAGIKAVERRRRGRGAEGACGQLG